MYYSWLDVIIISTMLLFLLFLSLLIKVNILIVNNNESKIYNYVLELIATNCYYAFLNLIENLYL